MLEKITSLEQWYAYEALMWERAITYRSLNWSSLDANEQNMVRHARRVRSMHVSIPAYQLPQQQIERQSS